MLKKAEVLTVGLNLSFKKRVQMLASEGSALASSYRELSDRMLRFAEKVADLSERAYELDDGEQGLHHRHLRSVLAKAVGTENEAVVSKWITIGSQVQALLPYKKSLPPQRECLYELAKAAEEKRPIEKWVSDNRLTIDSTVREVMALRKPSRSKRKHRQREYFAVVTLGFQDYEVAAETLKAIVLSDVDFRVRSAEAFEQAIKAKLGASAYEKAKERFG